MSMKKFLPSIMVLISLFSAQPCVFASDNYDGCKHMMAKLAIDYEIDTLGDRVNARKGIYTPVKDPIKRAERYLYSFYDGRKDTIDKKWPGLYQFSVLEAVDALDKKMEPEDFRIKATLNCIRTFP